MTRGNHGAALRQLRTLLERGSVGQLSDADLIDRFLARSPEGADAAFAALVERHGPAVFRVCRSVLGDAEAAQDAFQATFLVLVRKAGSVRVRESIGPWLVAVAYRTASGARSAASRRRVVEREAAEVRSQAGPPDEELAREIRAEVDRLAERYRRPILLCYFAGLTHEGAARQLGCPVGTVRSRLAWGRKQLRERLIRRGFGLSAALASLAATPGRAAVPTSLLIRTARVGAREAAGAVSAGAVVQAERVVRAMFMTKLKGIAAALLTLALVATGGGVLAQQQGNPGSAFADKRAQLGQSRQTREDTDKILEELGDRVNGMSRQNPVRAQPKVRPDVEIEMLLRAAREQEQAGHIDQAVALTARMEESLRGWREKLQAVAGQASQPPVPGNQDRIRRIVSQPADPTKWEVEVFKLGHQGEGGGTTVGSPVQDGDRKPETPAGKPQRQLNVYGPATLQTGPDGERLFLRGGRIEVQPPAEKAATKPADAPPEEGAATAPGKPDRSNSAPDVSPYDRRMLSLKDVQRAASPFPETTTIEQPAANKLAGGNQEKRRTRTPQFGNARGAVDLDRKVSLHTGGRTELIQAIKLLQSASAGPDGVVPIFFDLGGFPKAKASLDELVALNVDDAPLREVLQRLLDQANLAYRVEDGRVVIGAPRNEPKSPNRP